MKTFSAQPVKPNSNSRKDPNRSTVKGYIFLGHKVLSELRILMRLASGQSNGSAPNGNDHPSSL
ncbi:MAG TPA: hypothetical protein VNU68_30640 [Verrucomicrobiae bacterium]|nr:hypothetical protein [Verrucomicrobiae bacterium]